MTRRDSNVEQHVPARDDALTEHIHYRALFAELFSTARGIEGTLLTRRKASPTRKERLENSASCYKLFVRARLDPAGFPPFSGDKGMCLLASQHDMSIYIFVISKKWAHAYVDTRTRLYSYTLLQSAVFSQEWFLLILTSGTSRPYTKFTGMIKKNC
jgi:hypothetical protein